MVRRDLEQANLPFESRTEPVNIRSKAATIAFVAAPATLFGHALTYTFGALSLADGRHTYFLPTLQASVTIVLALGFTLILRSLFGGGSGARRRPSAKAWSEFLGLWAGLCLTQCALFISFEFFEGYRVGLFGCLMQCGVALIVTTLLVFFGALLERCEEISVAGGRYLPRNTNRLAVLHGRALSLAPVSGLNERRGLRRFQRPPPSL